MEGWRQAGREARAWSLNMVPMASVERSSLSTEPIVCGCIVSAVAL